MSVPRCIMSESVAESQPGPSILDREEAELLPMNPASFLFKICDTFGNTIMFLHKFDTRLSFNVMYKTQDSWMYALLWRATDMAIHAPQISSK